MCKMKPRCCPNKKYAIYRRIGLGGKYEYAMTCDSLNEATKTVKKLKCVESAIACDISYCIKETSNDNQVR